MMAKYIAILRGINVGGHRKILMADLKQLLKKIGFQNITTYIQSGNAVFSSATSQKDAEQSIKKAIQTRYGFEVPVMVRTAAYFQKLLHTNPYLKEDTIKIEQLYLTFLSEPPKEAEIKNLQSIDFGEDRFKIIYDTVFLCFETKLSDSKLNNNIIEKKLNVTATTRNWKTVTKLSEFANS